MHPPRGLLVDNERAPDVDPVNLVEVRQVKVGQGGGAVDPGGMDNDVEMPEPVLNGVEKGRYCLLVGDICGECRAAPTMVLDLADRRVGQVDAAGISHRDVEPVGRQLGGYDPAHTAGPSGHQRRTCAASRVTKWSHKSSPLRGRSSAH